MPVKSDQGFFDQSISGQDVFISRNPQKGTDFIEAVVGKPITIRNQYQKQVEQNIIKIMDKYPEFNKYWIKNYGSVAKAKATMKQAMWHDIGKGETFSNNFVLLFDISNNWVKKSYLS